MHGEKPREHPSLPIKGQTKEAKGGWQFQLEQGGEWTAIYKCKPRVAKAKKRKEKGGNKGTGEKRGEVNKGFDFSWVETEESEGGKKRRIKVS